jgi:hypothetical protein
MKSKNLLIALVVAVIGAYVYLHMNVREGAANQCPKGKKMKNGKCQ